jgi:DNA ligase-1
MRAMSARRQLPAWLDALDGTGRWALLKLVTGSLRVGVSTGLAKQALSQWSGIAQPDIEELWHGFAAPYLPLFAWLSGAAPRPSDNDALGFHSPMLSHPIEDSDFGKLNPKDFAAEWKWDGIRVQLKSRGAGARLFSRSGDEIGAAFPDLIDAPAFFGGLDGELVAMTPGQAGIDAVASFSTLQQRLNRKTGRIELEKLSTDKIRRWHHGLATAPKIVRSKAGATGRGKKDFDATDPEAVRRRRDTARLPPT